MKPSADGVSPTSATSCGEIIAFTVRNRYDM